VVGAVIKRRIDDKRPRTTRRNYSQQTHIHQRLISMHATASREHSIRQAGKLSTQHSGNKMTTD